MPRAQDALNPNPTHELQARRSDLSDGVGGSFGVTSLFNFDAALH